ncbi:uncharacterized protein N7443_007117 [Penicillium atrosanguineum]|uniref:uncharacterized protein n=1 Tax=Penicillium atrosanguineum TaxID=1132637 RepID=UPI00238A802F|nr:uncharacterized protein N7443_007117 [Penicillium atrosanguineum]KAJ5296224.1 hypothetical protein N7443_007117 [Penicillium atrosanguineum]
MDGIDLGAPIATLRSLGALATDNFRYKSGHSAKWSKSPITFDLISQCLLSDRDSQRAIDIFFKHCHPSAPVLEEDIRHFWREPDRYSPTLILAICSVGTRFWNNDSRRDTIDAVHPSFNNLTNLLDKAVSSLLLRPTPSDVTLDSVRVLLLYAQWMPCSREDGNDLGASQAHAPRSRYNEISAWAILGLAVRYATLLGLDRSAIASFRAHMNGPSEHDVNRLRVWYNLLTCSFNLMLTSGLPASIDPELSVQVAQRFSSHDKTQYPGDLRVTGLVELVGIVHRAMRSSRDVSARQLQAHSLQKLNSDMDAWERTWFSLLHNTEFQHNRLPFNSLRWYRLSLNSASLAPLLSATSPLPTELAREALRHPLKISLTAAAQMILSFSRFGSDFVWELDSQTPLSFPDGPFHVDAGSIGQLYYAVDSTWISHTFAVTFLVICYMRGIINENLQICFQKDSPNKIATKVSSSSWSILPRLLLLALEIFDGVCPTATFHFSRDFQGLIRYAVSLVMSLDQQDANGGETVDDLAFQSLLELMNDSGVDWAGSLLGEPGEFTDWNMSEMLDG